MALVFKANKNQTRYTLLGYRISRPEAGKPYAQIILGREMFAKEDSGDTVVGMTADSYYLPVEIVEQFTPDLVGCDCHAVINTTASNGRTYKNIAEISFEE